MYRILLFHLLIIYLVSCKSTKKYTPDTFVNGYEFPFTVFKDYLQIFDYAKENGLCMYIDFYADWCLPCQMMGETVYQDKLIAKTFKDGFINLKIDGEKYPELLDRYLVYAYPTIVVLDKEGNVSYSKSGALSANELLELGQNGCQ